MAVFWKGEDGSKPMRRLMVETGMFYRRVATAAFASFPEIRAVPSPLFPRDRRRCRGVLAGARYGARSGESVSSTACLSTWGGGEQLMLTVHVKLGCFWIDGATPGRAFSRYSQPPLGCAYANNRQPEPNGWPTPMHSQHGYTTTTQQYMAAMCGRRRQWLRVAPESCPFAAGSYCSSIETARGHLPCAKRIGLLFFPWRETPQPYRKLSRTKDVRPPGRTRTFPIRCRANLSIVPRTDCIPAPSLFHLISRSASFLLATIVLTDARGE